MRASSRAVGYNFRGAVKLLEAGLLDRDSKISCWLYGAKQVSMKEGLRRTLEAFKHLRKEALMGDPKPPTTAPPDKQAKAS